MPRSAGQVAERNSLGLGHELTVIEHGKADPALKELQSVVQLVIGVLATQPKPVGRLTNGNSRHAAKLGESCNGFGG
jgi:hypothetical protein